MKLKSKTYHMDQSTPKNVCAIIKLDTTKKVVIYTEDTEEADMNKNDEQAPKWFMSFATKMEQFIIKQEAFNAKQEKINEQVSEFMSLLLSLPTIKKEIKNIK